MLDWIAWILGHVAGAFWSLAWALTHPGAWLDWSEPAAVMRFAHYGGSAEFFFFILNVFLIVTVIGVFSHRFLWGVVRGLEGFANAVGRTFAWAGLLLVFQQILIVVLQRIFQVSTITISPFGIEFTQDLSWYAESLKFYNALVVALCVSWTFVQGGHVRVDLIYAGVSWRAKRVLDMIGCLIFMMPLATVVWFYGWFFLWRSLITPKISASDSFELMLNKARAFRWSVETVGFSPSGFNAYFLFKVLLVAFAALVFVQAMAFFWRCWLELAEGEEAIGRHHDPDWVGPGEAPLDAAGMQTEAAR